MYTYLSDRRMSTRRISPFHLPDGRLNPACIPKQKPVWCVSWGPEIVVHRDFGPSICMICKNEFPTLHLCFGGFCHHKRVCAGCCIPQERIACSNCWCKCKSSCKCPTFAQRVIRMCCIRCWEVLLMYEDQLETSPEGVATGQTKAPLKRHTPVGRPKQDLHQNEDKTTDSVVLPDTCISSDEIDHDVATATLSSDSEEDTVPFPPWKAKRKESTPYQKGTNPKRRNRLACE